MSDVVSLNKTLPFIHFLSVFFCSVVLGQNWWYFYVDNVIVWRHCSTIFDSDVIKQPKITQHLKTSQNHIQVDPKVWKIEIYVVKNFVTMVTSMQRIIPSIHKNTPMLIFSEFLMSTIFFLMHQKFRALPVPP